MKNKADMQNYSSNWYKSLSGRSSLECLDHLCSDILSEIFGYYAIQLGVLSGSHDLLEYSRIAKGFSLTEAGFEAEGKVSAISTVEQLPIATDNIDLVIASHVLELSENPHQVLREIDRILVPEGHCVLIGFNPFGLMRLPSYVKSTVYRTKHKFRMRSVPRVRDWFSLLGFEVLDVHYMGRRPSKNSKKVSDAVNVLEKLSRYTDPIMANMYIFHVKKQVVAMRPHKKVWLAPAVLTGGKVAINRTAQKIRRENYSNL